MKSIDNDESAAKDTATRQKIASFPPEVHDPSLLSLVKGIITLFMFRFPRYWYTQHMIKLVKLESLGTRLLKSMRTSIKCQNQQVSSVHH